MAHTMAYGDSREYYRLSALQHANAVAQYNAYASQMAAGSTSPIAALNPYQNAYAAMRNVTPAKQLKSPDKVIADCGFGGAESRPRSRRRRKAVLASIPVAGE